MSISLDVNNHATEHLEEEPHISTSISLDEKQHFLEMMKKGPETEVNNSQQQEELVEIESLFSKMNS